MGNCVNWQSTEAATSGGQKRKTQRGGARSVSCMLEFIEYVVRRLLSRTPHLRSPELFLLMFIAMPLAACSAPPTATPTPERLRIAGSTSTAPALYELAAAFQAAKPNVLVEVGGGGTTVGWDELRADRVEMAALSWWDEGGAVPEGYRFIPIGRDAVAAIVHPQNPISNATTLQLRALFGGEILDWSTLGDFAGEPAIVSREDGSGTRAAFETLIMGGHRVTLNALVMPTSEAMVDYVAAHRLAVGYVTPNAADDRVKVVPVEGLLPTIEVVRAGSYHMMRVLYLAVREPPPAAAQAFLDFVEGPRGQSIIGKYHVPLR